jgi:plastocyanin
MKTTRKIRTILALLAFVVLSAWPTAATPPYTAIIMESGSPYFVPKSATVSTGAPIRWENPTPSEHTATHVGCLEDGERCAFDTGVVLPNNTYTLPGLAPGRYPYVCRIHPIMHGVIIVTDPATTPSHL